MGLNIKRNVIFDISGQIVVGKIKEHATYPSYGHQFYPQLDAIINRMNDGDIEDPHWGIYKINTLISELEDIKDFLSAQKVTDELIK